MRKIVSAVLIIALISTFAISISSSNLVEPASKREDDNLFTAENELTETKESSAETTETIVKTAESVVMVEVILPETIESETTATEPNSEKETAVFTGEHINVLDIFKLPEFENVVPLIENYEKESAVYLIDLNSGIHFAHNEDALFFSASLIKLPFLYYCMEEIEKGKASFDDVLVYEDRHFSEGTGEMQFEEIGSEYTIKELIAAVLATSDNVAYMMLYDYFGYEGYNDLLASHGFEAKLDEYLRFGELTARTVAYFWEKIYQNKDKSKDWEILVESALASQFSLIRIGTGFSMDVANKSGWAEGAYHDSGIVFKENAPYIIVMMTESDGEISDQQFFYDVIEEINHSTDILFDR